MTVIDNEVSVQGTEEEYLLSICAYLWLAGLIIIRIVISMLVESDASAADGELVLLSW